jgi:hypothetical protein
MIPDRELEPEEIFAAIFIILVFGIGFCIGWLFGWGILNE